MLDFLFTSINDTALTGQTFLICTAASLVLGLGIALAYLFKTRTSGSFVLTLAILPAIVQMVIMLVNGNLGTGVAVMGAFSLIRFRSAPGSAKEIGAIFMAMAVGLATGMGYIGIAAIFTVILGLIFMLYSALLRRANDKPRKELKVTIPESLDYSEIFDDLMKQYTRKWELASVRTTQLGSLYQLTYQIELKDAADEKKLLDAIRCRNGNLEVRCGRMPTDPAEL